MNTHHTLEHSASSRNEGTGAVVLSDSLVVVGGGGGGGGGRGAHGWVGGRRELEMLMDTVW